MRSRNRRRATDLLDNLHEPNETCLGQSSGKPKGRGVGDDKASDLASALINSRAFSTGVLSDVSEAELFIRNIGPDTISDLTTNVLRGLLAKYTQDQCKLHNIPTVKVGQIGPVWSISTQNWLSTHLDLPIVRQKPILLVPKFSVRRGLSLNSQEFWNFHMIEFLREENLRNGTGLVKVFKGTGERYVTKASVKALHPLVKDDLASFVQKHPEVLETYKKLQGAQGSLSNEDFEKDFDEASFAKALIERLKSIKAGGKSAGEYHSIAMGICTFLFYPNLINPIKEKELHEGRKRIDIKYTNSASDGFFLRMLKSPQTRSISVMVECKNYSKDIENPEFDQLTSRFGHQRGFFGILLCRKLNDRARIVAACKDAANDTRGYMLVLEDIDLIEMLEAASSKKRGRIDRLLQERFDEISH